MRNKALPAKKAEKKKEVSSRRHFSVWILVADEGIARLFRRDGNKLAVLGEIVPVALEGNDLTNKYVGRVASSSMRSLHHKYEPHMNESRKSALAFMHEIADWLDNFLSAGHCDRAHHNSCSTRSWRSSQASEF